MMIIIDLLPTAFGGAFQTQIFFMEIKQLGGFHYHLALSFALWNDYRLPQKTKLIKPF
jgi:hypothetical protein